MAAPASFDKKKRQTHRLVQSQSPAREPQASFHQSMIHGLWNAGALAAARWLYRRARNGITVIEVKHFLQPVALESDDNENRQEKGNEQVGNQEGQQGREHLSFWQLRHGADEEPFKNAQPAGRI